jgi:hypothetical protein
MVEDRKVDYINSKRLDKPLVALGIIKEWRGQEPPGRFLKVDDRTGYWNDVGDKKAREKTSQALREKAPILRKQQEEELTSQERKERGLPEVGFAPPPCVLCCAVDRPGVCVCVSGRFRSEEIPCRVASPHPRCILSLPTRHPIGIRRGGKPSPQGSRRCLATLHGP